MKFLSVMMLGFLGLLALPALAADKAPKYAPVDIQSLSNALFKIGVLRPNDPAAVDEYIRIHHCGLYEQYGANDLAWTRIREAQARELVFLSPKMNEGLEVSGPLLLDRYDITQNAFLIAPVNSMENMGLVEVVEYRSGSFDPCPGESYKSFVPRVHPLHLTARLSNPMTLTSLPMNQSLADKLIKIMNTRVAHDPERQREVTMVIRMRLTGADPLSGSTETSDKTVTADMDEVLIYDGPERNELLFRKSFIDPADKKKKPR